MSKKKDTGYHIGRNEADPGQRREDQVSSQRLRKINAPGAPSSLTEPRPRARSESFDFIKATSHMAIPVADPDDPLQLMDPESSLRLLSQSHMDYFGEDFWAAKGEFIKLRFHVGLRGDVYEFYSDAYPLSTDTWSVLQPIISEHIRSELAELGKALIKQVPVRMVFFHDPQIHAPPDREGNVLRQPLDFATSVTFAAGEFIDYVNYGRRPERFRIGFDASYLYLGTETGAAFSYSNHWLFFTEVLRSFAELFGRPFAVDELPLRVLREHADGDVASLVTGIGMSEKRTYQSRDRVYRPQVDVVFEPDQLEVRLTDKTGILRGFTNHYAAGTYHKTTDGNVTLLTKRY
ncbi:MAG: hypothetical protein ABI333_03990 [bacterium]